MRFALLSAGLTASEGLRRANLAKRQRDSSEAMLYRKWVIGCGALGRRSGFIKPAVAGERREPALTIRMAEAKDANSATIYTAVSDYFQ